MVKNELEYKITREDILTLTKKISQTQNMIHNLQEGTYNFDETLTTPYKITIQFTHGLDEQGRLKTYIIPQVDCVTLRELEHGSYMLGVSYSDGMPEVRKYLFTTNFNGTGADYVGLLGHVRFSMVVDDAVKCLKIFD